MERVGLSLPVGLFHTLYYFLLIDMLVPCHIFRIPLFFVAYFLIFFFRKCFFFGAWHQFGVWGFFFGAWHQSQKYVVAQCDAYWV